MNIKTIGTTAFLALAGALLSPSHAVAARTYSDGDLILGFRGATTSYEVNIGSAQQLLTATSAITFNLGNIKLDLDTNFAGWATSSGFLWSLSGTQATAGFVGARTLFASRAQSIPAALGTASSTPWSRGSLNGQGTPTNEMVELGTKFAAGTSGGQVESLNSAFAVIQPNSEINSYRSYMPGGDVANSTSSAAFKYFNGGIESNFGNGTTAAYLDIYDIRTGSGASDFIGNLSIDASSGDVTFTPEGVPEPTTVATLGAGLVMLITRRRRQTA